MIGAGLGGLVIGGLGVSLLHNQSPDSAAAKRGELLPLTTRTVASEAPEGRAIAEFVERALGDLDLDE